MRNNARRYGAGLSVSCLGDEGLTWETPITPGAVFVDFPLETPPPHGNKYLNQL